MNILVLTFYYEPDLSAGSFRITAFVKKLQEALKETDSISIITTVPNRYDSFKRNALEIEKQGNIAIRRIQLPPHKSGMVDQSRSFLKYALSTLNATKKEKYDLILATSSRLFTAFLGAIIARRTGAKLYLDIRDIFNDTMNDVLNPRILPVVQPLLNAIERYTIQSADRINLVSRGFQKYFSDRYPEKVFSYIPNGIDSEFLTFDFKKKIEKGKKIIVYAGNIGQGQGLEKIVPVCAEGIGKDYEFWIIGDGSTKKALLAKISDNNLSNVKVINPVERSRLLKYYQESDILFMHLNDYDAFKKVLPSKVFEYAATGKPIIAGVNGYAKEFIEQNIINAVVFEPCNAADFLNKLKMLKDDYQPRLEFNIAYQREKLMKEMVVDFLNCLIKGVEANNTKSVL
jgi:glycosyltransferase involved in cell wall biosynthesis